MTDSRGVQLPMPEDHSWQVREGFVAIVADRGAVRFDIPREWHVEGADDCDLQVTDRPPPDDDCRLQLSLLRQPFVGPATPSLVGMLSDVGGPRDGSAIVLTPPHLDETATAELAWSALAHTEDGRDAITRTLLGRGPGLHVLFTWALWADQAEQLEPAWVELRRSLRVGVAYDLSGRDPRRN